jgi:two-component system sensor histidine kinase/response regulator
MRNWTIRSKLLAIPSLAVLLFVVGSTADSAFAEHRRAVGVVLVLSSLVLFIAGWMFAGSVTRRLQRLVDALHAMQAQAVEQIPLDSGRGDEITALTKALNTVIRAANEREAELKRSTEFLEFAQTAGGFGVFDFDLHERSVTGTKLFFELIGLESADMTLSQAQWLATIHPDDLEGFVDCFTKALTEQGNYQAEYRCLRLDGTLRWLAGRGRVLLEPAGRARRLIGTITDVTERRHLDEQLRATSNSLEIAQRSAGVATFDLDFADNRFVATDNYREMMNVPPSTPLRDLTAHLAAVHPEDFARIQRAAFETTPEDPTYRCEYRVLLEGGAVRWIGERAHVTHNHAGELVRLTGATVDITDLKEARLAAESANRAKSNFLANVSHEIRTPMNGVIGMTEILAETDLDDAQRDYTNIIRGSAQALLSLINDVLDISKIEAQRLELEHIEFNIRDMIYEAVSATAFHSAMKGIELIVNFAAEVPFLVTGDPGRVRQIVMNLIGNAIKFTHEGYVCLSVRHVDVDCGTVDLLLAIEDTGIGIPADRLDRLFQSFSQIDSSTTRHYGGSGLGLSIVKSLAELMNGEVSVESEPGKGSTFRVRLRVGLAAEQPTAELFGLGKRILVVDDIAASRASLATKLGMFGYTTQTVGGVAEALAALREGPPFDLVLADELMPVQGGFELLELLRKDPEFSDLPVVLLSLFGAGDGNGDREHQPNAIGLKPMRGTALARLVDAALSPGKQPRRQSKLPLGLVSPAHPEGGTDVFPGRQILLVEDNPVNQRVAQRILQKLGAVVTIANHGAEALERLAVQRYDAVLMDCQMPVMDGFEATRTIRAAERQRGRGEHLPIIALTANVMSEDRQKCIAAGMDAHLGKPINPSHLADCLQRYLEPGSVAPPVDMAALHALTDGDADFERELIDTFIASGDETLAEILAALPTQDFEIIGRRAHALKSASANIHATRLSRTAAKLELAAKASEAAQIGLLVNELAADLRSATDELRKVG